MMFRDCKALLDAVKLKGFANVDPQDKWVIEKEIEPLLVEKKPVSYMQGVVLMRAYRKSFP